MRRGAWRRHALGLMSCFALVASGVLWAAPLVKRNYVVEGRVPVDVHAVEGVETRQIPEMATTAVAGRAAEEGVRVTVASGGEDRTIHVEGTGESRAAAVERVQEVSDRLALVVRERGEEMIAALRTELGKDGDRLAAEEAEATRAVEAFRVAHRGALPEDPNSVTGQLEQVSGRVEDKQQRLAIVTAQIGRLEAYEKNQALPPPPPLPPQVVDAGAPVKAENDPEVTALTAQMQLLNDQVDDQLNNKHRTEQHPYVIDLREQQAALQKKLDAAKQRVAAGQPPPASVPSPLTPAVSPNSATVAAAQGVDFQMQSLLAERDALNTEIPALITQRQGLQKQVDGILPVRQDYEKLTGRLAAVQKQRQTVTAQLEQAERTGTGVEVGPLAIAADSGLPVFPRIPVVYGLAILAAAAVTAALAWVLAKMDRTLHSPAQAAAMLDVPIAGAVMELRTRRQEMRERMWRGLGRPLVAVGLIVVIVGSGVLCYRQLADGGTLASSTWMGGLGL
jgi:predicted phage tail protein